MPNKINSTPGEVETVRPKPGTWRTYDVTDGLPGGVWCMLQDHQGYLWLGTGAGLCRYDGVEFLTYTVAEGLTANRVAAICEDRHGRLWVGTGGPFGGGNGISCFDGDHFTTYTTADGLAHNEVTTICEDRLGRLWVGTNDGVSCFDGDRFITYTAADGLAHNGVHGICEDRLGRLWVGTPGGVSRFDGNRFATYTTADGLAYDDVHAICEDRLGRLWVGGWRGGGVSRFDGDRFTTYTTADGLAHNDVRAICEDRDGRLWVGTYGGGVSCFDGEHFITYTVKDGLLDNRVSGIFQDREGGLWFAQFWSGLTCFDAETVMCLTDQPVSEILIQDSQGRLWFGDDKDLICLCFDTLRTQHKFEGQARRQPFAGLIDDLLEDSRGRFWVATAGAMAGDGLYRYDSASAVWARPADDKASARHRRADTDAAVGGEGIRHFTTADGLGSDNIASLLETRDGAVWAGTWGSDGSPGCLCRFDGEAFLAIPTPHSMVSVLYEDKRGRIWMGGWGGGGLSCYDGGRPQESPLQTYTTADGLPSDNVQSIVEDDSGRLWMGTQEGLCCFDGERFIAYGKEEGLFSLVHQRSAKDALGQLWFGTQAGGLYRYDGKHFQSLTKEDGLPHNSITGLLPQPDGSMIIGTFRGIVHYRPTATLPPRIEIREVVADRVYRNPTELELTATGAPPSVPPAGRGEGKDAPPSTGGTGGGVPLLTISYYGLSFATRQMRYSYILEGYDPEWQDTWENRIRYENLPVGEYTFKVIAINRDLVESEVPATLKLTIVPDPREAQIAQLESDLEVRNRELEQANAELTRLSQFKSELLSVVSHELRTPLTSIDGFTRLIHERFLTEDLIAQCNEATRPTVQRVKDRVQIIRENTSRLSRLINDLLDFSRIERGRELEMHFARVELSGVIETVMATYQAPAADKGLTLRYDGEIPLHSGALEVLGDADRLAQVLSNLVSNAVKFTPEGGVITISARKAVGQTVSLSTTGAGKVVGQTVSLSYIELTVQDTGVGIPQEQLASIFEPFEQAGTSDAKKSGTGLGLAIVKSIVERHEGTVRVESEVGVGSAFIVTLPEYVAEAPAHTTPQRILIVDDDYDILRLLEEGLSAYPNTRIITAGNSQDALTILSTQPCDVMITDVRMPGDISGLELARQVREKYPALKIFVMTNTPEEKARVVQLHSDWIDKAMPNLIHYIAKKIGRE
ncbi:response regulator [Candidatus Poribacteria bacterium]|nr:response regulator [Candidatus Poribacteria bacterium]